MILHLIIAGAAALMATDAARGQSLELSDCRISAGPAYPGIKARCGQLERPLNPAAPDGETVSLRVAVVPALTLEPAPDPVVPIAGGPGQASTDFYAGTANAFETLRLDRDILLVDQRGTGGSAALDCDDDDVLRSQDSIEETVAAARDCLDELPYDPRYFTTSVAVRDLEAVREALGYEQLNLYGISYGTRVAQHYARRYPESTRTIILDGVVPPQIALGPAVAVEAQRALNAIFDRCQEDERCAAEFPGLADRFDALIDRFADETSSVTLPHPVTGKPETVRFGVNEVSGAVRLLSYHPTTIALIPLLVDQASKGNLIPLAAQYLAIRDGFADSLSGGMHNAVVCTEDAPYFGGEAISDQELSATYIGPMMREALVAICSIWPAGVIDEDFKTPLASDIPVLLLSGEADPITPPRYAELAAVDLGNALLLTGPQQGHGLAPRGCTPELMADFVDGASVTGVDASCVDRQFAMPFFLDFSGPSP